MRSTHITIDCRKLRDSGVGVYLRNNLAKIIAKTSYKFSLIGNQKELHDWLKAIELGSSEISIIPCDASIFSLREQIEIWKKIPKNCDLFWSPFYVIPIIYNGMILVTFHDVFPLAMSYMVPSLVARIYAKLMFGFAARKASKIITVSNFTKREIIKYIKIEERKIEVIHAGYNKVPQGNSETIIEGPFILYVGNIKPHKNLSRILAAHAKIFPKFKWPLVMVGKTEGFIISDTKLHNMIKTIPKGQVFMVGQVSDEELSAYYKKAGVLVLASLYEGFGLPAVEAMGAGIPILASQVASLPEICGDAALYCDPYSVNDIADKMALLISDTDLQAQLREKGEKQVNKFSWDDSVKSHLKIINDLLLRC